MKTIFRNVSLMFIGGVLLCLLAPALLAAPPALNGKLVVRPLTPQDIKDYTLTGQQGASGLTTVGIGQPAYLDALVNVAVPPGDITGVTWNVVGKPAGSLATLAASPLGANVPPFAMLDRLEAQVASRRMLRADVAGVYTVTVQIVTGASGTANLTNQITASQYMGVTGCSWCHGGDPIGDKYHPWLGTGHASFFTRAIDGLASDHYASYCISCHTVGYDVNTNANNGGFDDVAKALGWTFPSVLTNGNWAAMPADLQDLSNIQCENCHGPGFEHAVTALLSGADAAKQRIGKSFGPGVCGQCHDSKNNHIRNIEWNNSRHAIAVEETEPNCSRCHTAKGFANYTSGEPAEETPYDVITCAACHESHDATNPHQLRKVSPVTLMDTRTTITEGGTGLLCMNCHMSRRNATNYVEVTAGSSRFGPHHGPQADMLAGANAMNYGKEIPSSAHREVVKDSCSTCHMQNVASTNAAYLHAGGHTFKPAWEGDGTNGPVHLVAACAECHGDIESFDFKRQDYDGDGVVEGVQTEVHGLLARLALLLPPVGVAKTSIAINSSWSRPQLRAGYNYLFVEEDGSFGVHNLSYAVGLLKASIADLTGDANEDSLPDAWQVQYFGSMNNPNAAPNACPAGDGVPNWLKYSLGLDPLVPATGIPGDVVWANGKLLGGGTDKIHIFTAAEVAFDTGIGTNYQIQAVSSLSGGWQNVGNPIPGTGTAISYVTPTRTNVQQFYRVVHTP